MLNMCTASGCMGLKLMRDAFIERIVNTNGWYNPPPLSPASGGHVVFKLVSKQRVGFWLLYRIRGTLPKML